MKYCRTGRRKTFELYAGPRRSDRRSIDKFNVEFMRMLDRNRFTVQLQTAGKGIPCEKQLPDSLKDRVAIALDFAKILRTCAKNKIAYVDIKPLEHLFGRKRKIKFPSP